MKLVIFFILLISFNLLRAPTRRYFRLRVVFVFACHRKVILDIYIEVK